MKASTHLDWIIALIIFLTGFILAVTYAKASMNVKIPEEKIIASALEELDSKLSNVSVEVNVYKLLTPNICVKNYPCEFKITEMNNVSVLNSTGDRQLVVFENGTLRTILNWCNNFKVIEINESVIYPNGNAWITDSSMGNDQVNISYNSTHITSLKYKTTEFLSEATGLGTTQILERNSDSTQAEVVFDTLNLSVDSFSPRVWIATQPKTLNFSLKFFQNCYIGNSLYDCTSINSIEKISNLTSLYNTSVGISFIGNNLDTTITNLNNASILLSIKGLKKLEIYFHSGDYTLAENESKAFNLNCTLLPYITYKPISSEKLSSKGISLEKFNYRIEVENLSFGSSIPLLTNIYRRDIPLLIVKNGILNTTTLSVWIWK